MIYIINIAFVKYLTPAHFEAYATISIFTTLFYSIFMGSMLGIQPVLSQYMGAGNFKDLKVIFKCSVKKTTIYAIAGFIILLPVIKPLLSLFLTGAGTLDLGIFMYITIGFAVLFSNIPIQASLFFTAINRPVESALISIARTFILIPVFSYLFIRMLQAPGISLGLIIADLVLIAGFSLYFKKLDISLLKVSE